MPERAKNPSQDGGASGSVRFTVDLPRALHKRLKLAALHREQAMTDLARDALAQWLDSEGC
jgi:predicted transcriptional regulator